MFHVVMPGKASKIRHMGRNPRQKLHVSGQSYVNLSVCQNTISSVTTDDRGTINSHKAGGITGKGVPQGQGYILECLKLILAIILTHERI